MYIYILGFIDQYAEYFLNRFINNLVYEVSNKGKNSTISQKPRWDLSIPLFVQQTEVISFIILYDKEKKQILICKKVEPANVLLVSK